MNSRSAQPVDRADLTAKAVIREEALRLFAARGPDRVSLRDVARAAGVSAGLVMHHYGSRQGLRDAVDAHVAEVFDGLFAGTDGFDPTADASSFADVITSALSADSPIPAYLRRLLLEGGPAGAALFARWLAASRALLDGWVEAGMVRQVQDPAAVAAFLMVNDLALLILRDRLTEALGVDPLSRDGMARWVQAVMDVYRDGLFGEGIAGAGPAAAGPAAAGPVVAGEAVDGRASRGSGANGR